MSTQHAYLLTIHLKQKLKIGFTNSIKAIIIHLTTIIYAIFYINILIQQA